MCAFCSFACAIWEGLIGRYFRKTLPWDALIPVDETLGAAVIGLLIFFSYAIVMNTVVPISLYVSVEVCKSCYLDDSDQQLINFRFIYRSSVLYNLF